MVFRADDRGNALRHTYNFKVLPMLTDFVPVHAVA
jgi:hypothetical protein